MVAPPPLESEGVEIEVLKGGCSPTSCCASSSSSGSSSESVRELDTPIWPLELAGLIDKSIRDCFRTSKNRSRIVPLTDLIEGDAAAFGDDGYVGLFVPVHLLGELLEFCSLELGLSFECPTGLVYEEPAIWTGEPWSSSEKYRDCARICDACAVRHDGNLEGREELVDHESSSIVSSSRGYCQVKRFRAMFRDLLGRKINEATGVVLARMGTEVDAQGRIVFRRRIHESDFLHNAPV